MTKAPPGTWTVYGLVDPRDRSVRYVGKTTRALADRLDGHLRAPAPRVAAWLAELGSAGLTPEIKPIREGVPAADLPAAEQEEVTRILLAGGTLLNEQLTAAAARVFRGRRDAAHAAARAAQEAARAAGWREVAGCAIRLLGGPLPPGDLPEIPVPDTTWTFISQVRPTYEADLVAADKGPRDGTFEDLCDIGKSARKDFWSCAEWAWSTLRGLAGQRAAQCMREVLDRAVDEAPLATRAEVSRFAALAAWYMVAVRPWWYLAHVAGIVGDDAAFTSWAGREPETREALGFLAARGTWVLRTLNQPWYWHAGRDDEGPGCFLGAVAVSYSGGLPPAATQPTIIAVLSKAGRDAMLTGPMAGLLSRLAPQEPGFASRLPATALPDYDNGEGWTGPGVPGKRATSGSLVRAGLAVPGEQSPGHYLAGIRSLWSPDDEHLRRAAEDVAGSNNRARSRVSYRQARSGGTGDRRGPGPARIA